MQAVQTIRPPGLFSRNIWIGVVFFLLSVAPGLWSPAISNILDSYNALWVTEYAAAIAPAVAIISSLFFAALADRRFEAQKLLGVLSISGAIFLWLSFSVLEWGWSPWWFVFFQGCNALIAAPMWALLTKVALVNSRNAEHDFPLFRVWGTIGWICAGLVVSYLALDSSVMAGKIAAYVRIFMGLSAFMLPRTPPEVQLKIPNLLDKLGWSAFSLLENRKLRVYFLSALLLALPLASFYLYAPVMLKALAARDQSEFALVVQWFLPGASAQMTLGQFVEIGAMLFLSWVGVRARVKWLMIIAMVFCLFRFALFALAGHFELLSLMWLGIAMHGICYTFFSVTGQMFVDRQVPKNMRAQAQSLMGLLASVGGIIGPLLVGQLFKSTAAHDFALWPIYWWILTVAVLVSVVYFVVGFRGDKIEV